VVAVLATAIEASMTPPFARPPGFAIVSFLFVVFALAAARKAIRLT
jgi:hypothetical protein